MTDLFSPQPHTLFWEATLQCNAYCAFCGSRCTSARKEELTTQQICRTLDLAAEVWNAKQIMLNVTGGEPLLRRDLFEVTAHARSLGFSWGLVTNGSLIDERMVGKMRAAGMKTISVSIDGMKEYHENVRRLPGGFDRIINGIRLLRQANFLDDLMVTTVVNHENISELEPLGILLHELKIDTWRVAMVDPIGRARENDHLLLTNEDRRTYFDFLARHRFDTAPVVTTSCSHYLGAYDSIYRPHAFSCESGRSVLSILSNGDIAGCPNVPRRSETIQGNVLRDDLKHVWETGFSFCRNDMRRIGKCAACALWDSCRGDSLHTWNFDENKPNFCPLEQGIPAEASKAELPPEVLKKLKAHHPALQGIRFRYGSSESTRVFFTPSASEEMRVFFQWGHTHPRNRCELMAALIGHEINNGFLIEFIVPLPLESRSEAQAAFSEQTYAAALEELNIINAALPLSDECFRLFDSPCILLGFAHTHPNGLDARLSIADMELLSLLHRHTGIRLFVLLNPHARDLCAYFHSAFVPCDAEVLTDAADNAWWK